MSTMYVITPDHFTQTEELCYQLSKAPECNTLPSYLCDQTGLRFVHGGLFHSHFDWSAYSGHDASKITLVPKTMTAFCKDSYTDALIETVCDLSGDATIFVDMATDATFNRAWKHRSIMMWERMVFSGDFLAANIANDIARFNANNVWYQSGDTHPDDSTNYRAALLSAGYSMFEIDFVIMDGGGKKDWGPIEGEENDAFTIDDLATTEMDRLNNSSKISTYNAKLSQALHIGMKDMNDSRGSVITSLAGKGITATESMFEMYNGWTDGTDDSSTAITDTSLITAIKTKVNHTGTFNYVAP